MFDWRFFAFSFLLILFGCGGGDGDNNETNGNSNVKNISINAQDLLTFTKGNSRYTVDLRDKVTAEDGQSLIISNLNELDNNCSITEKNSLTFSVYTNNNSVCRFKYSVEPSSSDYKGNAEAIVQVVSTSDYKTGTYLPPVSKTVQESGKIVFDSSDLLIESGFGIDPDSIQLIGDTESKDIGFIESADEKSIIYQAPEATTGTVRIFYSEIDKINNIVRPGVIYIAIGQDSNSSPVAINNTLDDLYLTNGQLDIDISAYISDDDGDDLQLIYLSVFLGNAEITSDKTFHYSIDGTTGRESIVYVVSDHNGGYGIGTLSFYIKAYEYIFDETQNLLFSPPFVFSDLNDDSIMSGSFHEDGITGIPGLYPTFDRTLATGYCQTKGMKLATLNQLKAMRKSVLDDKPVFLSEYKWNSGLPFLTIDDNSISLDNGTENNAVKIGYFSCVKDFGDKPWEFIQPYYGSKFGVDTTVFIVAESGDGFVFYPENDYDLAYSVSEFKVDGVDRIDVFDDYIDVNIKANVINVKRKIEDDSVINLRLSILDETSKATTTLIYGLTKCSSEFSSPELANDFLCVNTVTGNGSEKFTLAISNDILDANNVSGLSDDPYIGLGYVKFANIKWGGESYENRKQWLDNLKKMCVIMNQLKIDGRDNWDAGADNIPDHYVQKVFLLNDDDLAVASSYTEWLAKQDGSVDSSNYGQGYVPLDPNFDFYINQLYSLAGFASQNDGTTLVFPSCYSKN
ncbi:Ig-like domain-containing protein [Photobacterium damselae]|uniref:Ig-like domain-containing protein n=1 Tax=Photobacterium damselae TaxID=38293 RepID=UPI003D7DDC3F